MSVAQVAVALPANESAGDPNVTGGNVNEKDGKVVVGAIDVSIPVGSEGREVRGCTDSSVQVYIDDDFRQEITTDFYLVDAFDGSTLNAFFFAAARGKDRGVRLFSETGRWYGVFCDGDLYFVAEGGPPVTIQGLVQRAVDLLDPPDPGLEVTPHHGKHVVNMQSWLAVDPVYWAADRERTVRAGRVEVTATLTPFEMVWDMGNGDLEACQNPGVVWRAGMREDQSTCSYTYGWPSIDSPTETYDLTGTIRFGVTHQTNAPGTYGPFVPVERSTTEVIRVVEIQAVGR